MSDDPLDPARLTGLDVSPERLREIVDAFESIRIEIEKLRALDLEEVHPAVVYRPVRTGGDA